MIEYLTKDEDMLDQICYNHYGRRPGAVEAALEANPHLAEQPPILSAGVMIILPDLKSVDCTPTVRLWD